MIADFTFRIMFDKITHSVNSNILHKVGKCRVIYFYIRVIYCRGILSCLVRIGFKQISVIFTKPWHIPFVTYMGIFTFECIVSINNIFYFLRIKLIIKQPFAYKFFKLRIIYFFIIFFNAFK